METGRIRTVPEEILLEIVARLPLRSIARFKSVSKTWKSVTESAYFRRLFLSLHKKSSSSWSLMFPYEYGLPITEAIVFHGCKIWGLPKALGSYIFPFKPHPKGHIFYRDSSNGLFCMEVYDYKAKLYKSLVGNPVLKQWVEIPQPPEPCYATGLITCVDEDGLVSSFKVVRTCQSSRDIDMYEWRVYVYSSESRLWTFKRLLSSHPFHYNDSTCGPSSMNVNGILYLWERGLDPTEPGVLVAHDFYGPEADDQCRVIPLPLPYNKHVTLQENTDLASILHRNCVDKTIRRYFVTN